MSVTQKRTRNRASGLEGSGIVDGGGTASVDSGEVDGASAPVVGSWTEVDSLEAGGTQILVVAGAEGGASVEAARIGAPGVATEAGAGSGKAEAEQGTQGTYSSDLNKIVQFFCGRKRVCLLQGEKKCTQERTSGAAQLVF